MKRGVSGGKERMMWNKPIIEVIDVTDLELWANYNNQIACDHIACCDSL